MLSVREQISDVEIAIRPQLQQKDLRFSIAGCDPSATVFADADKVQQILINLVANAIKFTSAGGEIALATARAPRMLEISVRDSGAGIPPDRLHSVFAPFVQIRQSAAEPREGAGLGLAISRDLARAMGGDLRASSEVGVGSVFRLFLPVTEASETLPPAADASDSAVQSTLPHECR